MAKQRVISIIDDDASVREATARLLRSLGYRTATFSSAEEYLRSDRRHDSSCLITDLNMPGMGGADLQERLIAAGHRTPMIFMTAYFEEKARDRVLNAGASGFLRKPFAEDILVACLEKALNEPDAEPVES